jgi:hypothetical protein
LSSGSGPVIQTTVTDLAPNVQRFLFRWSTGYGPVCPAMPVIRYFPAVPRPPRPVVSRHLARMGFPIGTIASPAGRKRSAETKPT